MSISQNQFAFADVSDQEFEALLYTALFNEVSRLNVTYRARQRQQIRSFILSCGKLFLQIRALSENRETFPQKMQQ